MRTLNIDFGSPNLESEIESNFGNSGSGVFQRLVSIAKTPEDFMKFMRGRKKKKEPKEDLGPALF